MVKLCYSNYCISMVKPYIYDNCANELVNYEEVERDIIRVWQLMFA